MKKITYTNKDNRPQYLGTYNNYPIVIGNLQNDGKYRNEITIVDEAWETIKDRMWISSLINKKLIKVENVKDSDIKNKQIK